MESEGDIDRLRQTTSEQLIQRRAGVGPFGDNVVNAGQSSGYFGVISQDVISSSSDGTDPHESCCMNQSRLAALMISPFPTGRFILGFIIFLKIIVWGCLASPLRSRPIFSFCS